MKTMNHPHHLYYTTGHQWVRLNETYALMGITDFAQKALTQIMMVTVPYLNLMVEQGRYLGSIETDHAELELFMPVTGIIVEINPEIRSAPGSVNRDCYHTWLVKIGSMQTDQTKTLLIAEEYEAHIWQAKKNRKHA